MKSHFSYVYTCVLGLCLMTLAACSSLNDKADKLMGEKAYEEAETIYKEILVKHPHDTHALLGLKKARQGAISSELLLVRRQRLGGNSEQAAEALRSILISLREWKVYPTGAVAFTQSEEMNYAVRDLEERAREILAQRHPLKLAYLLDRYRDFFQEKTLPVYKQLHDAASSMGLAQCRSRLSSTPADLSYYREFLAKECVLWGDSHPEMKTAVQHGLFGHISLQGSVPGVPDALTPRLQNEIQHFLQDSPWFEGTSNKTLTAVYRGTYSFKTERRATQFTHAYQESEPYSSTEFVTKHRAHVVPVTKREVLPDGNVATVTTSEILDEPYTEMETVTRVRTVTKSFAYPGTEIEQNIALHTVIGGRLDGRADGKLDDSGKDFQLTATSTDRNLTSESQTESPRVGLNARHATLHEEAEWLARLLPDWSRQNLEQLRDLWVRKHCQDFQTDWNEAQQGDRVFSCLRERSRPAPAFIDAWLQQNLGVPSSELRSLLF